MGKKRNTNEPEGLPDGYYWFKNFVNLRGGGHVRRWKLAQVVGGRVRVVGSASELDQGCPYLRHALWVRAEPPDAASTAVSVPAERRQAGTHGGAIRTVKQIHRAGGGECSPRHRSRSSA